ncbi:hypothetical protein GUJ93_ZPchr0006g43352 [Zizania palustris]|uniref:Uncharacterized protein n=1 Tax=Zizania palustris TaxID=103762 RepID=A0A8J5VX72_ZIZPA|nr:hypothetical protein GUJ93_ZPchr0006g43352 [Zizania palustris]
MHRHAVVEELGAVVHTCSRKEAELGERRKESEDSASLKESTIILVMGNNNQPFLKDPLVTRKYCYPSLKALL